MAGEVDKSVMSFMIVIGSTSKKVVFLQFK